MIRMYIFRKDAMIIWYVQQQSHRVFPTRACVQVPDYQLPKSIVGYDPSLIPCPPLALCPIQWQTLRHTTKMQTSLHRDFCELSRWLLRCRKTGLLVRLTNMCQHSDPTTTRTKPIWWSRKVPFAVQHTLTTGLWQFWSQAGAELVIWHILGTVNVDKGKQIRNTFNIIQHTDHNDYAITT